MKKYIIDENVIQGLLNYLIEKPYKEVEQGIQALMSLEELKEGEENDRRTN